MQPLPAREYYAQRKEIAALFGYRLWSGEDLPTLLDKATMLARMDVTPAFLLAELMALLDRLGRNLRHLINTVHELTARGVGFQVLTGHGTSINTATPEGKLVFGIFAALSEFERELISERTKVGLASARARGRKGGGQYKMTSAKLRLAMAAMGQSQTVVSELCKELGVTRQTLYRHLGPDGSLREDGKKVLSR
jgi:DNA invertase Pin-like site-specific DNA recombinase